MTTHTPHLRYLLCAFALLLGRGLLAAEPADQPPAAAPPAEATPEVSLDEPTGKYIRLVRDDEDRPVEMQTAIVRFAAYDEDQAGLTVDLIAAVHIGEKSYYERLNRQFQKYDALLYELVAPEGTRVPKGGAKSDHPVSKLQTMMKDLLALDFQLDHVDYHQENFVHADMSPERFAQSMNDRGESVWALVFRMLGQSMAQQSKHPDRSFDADLLLALFDKNRALALKRVLAEQFEDLEGAMTAFNGPDGSTLITERNKRALEVLGDEIKSGKKHLAIFYGAGHMPDMARRLIDDFHLKPRQEQWITAWDLHPRGKQAKRAGKPAKSAAKQEKKPALQPVDAAR